MASTIIWGFSETFLKILFQEPKKSFTLKICDYQILQFLQFEVDNIKLSFKGGVLGSPRHSPHLWFIPSAHLDFFAIFVIPSPHLDNHTFTSPRVQIIPSPHLDHHTVTSPRVQIMPSPHLELHTFTSPRGQIISYLLQLKSNSIVDVPLIFHPAKRGSDT